MFREEDWPQKPQSEWTPEEAAKVAAMQQAMLDLEAARVREEPEGRVLMLTDPEAMQAFQQVFDVHEKVVDKYDLTFRRLAE